MLWIAIGLNAPAGAVHLQALGLCIARQKEFSDSQRMVDEALFG